MAATERGPLVCDAGPLIHLDELGCVGLLDDVGEILVPVAVWREVEQHRLGALRAGIPLRQIGAGAIPPDINVLAHALNLHAGEREALCVARQYQSKLLLTDDTAARLAAGSLGISVHGTIGILFRAIRTARKSGPEITALLRSLPAASTLDVRRSLLDEFIRQAEQWP
jgi:predicted nucleic acid-binding protein